MATLSATPQLPPGQSPSANNYPRIQIFPCRGTLHRAPLSFPSRNSRFPSPIPISETLRLSPQFAARELRFIAAELGGTVLAPPFDVFDAGRMAVVQDPTGAVLCLWQPNKNTGTGISASHGTLCWADLNTPDQARAGQFYSDLFGWQMMKEDEDLAHNYWHIKNGEEFIGGIPPVSHRQPGTPAHWMAYFTVSDCDATAAAARNLGATLYVPPTDFEDVGRISIMADPQGAAFAIFKAAARGASGS